MVVVKAAEGLSLVLLSTTGACVRTALLSAGTLALGKMAQQICTLMTLNGGRMRTCKCGTMQRLRARCAQLFRRFSVRTRSLWMAASMALARRAGRAAARRHAPPLTNARCMPYEYMALPGSESRPLTPTRKC
jgi:hypothetical protein